MIDVLSANISVHTALADHYNAVEPHFRPENQQKVRGRLAQLRSDAPGGKLIDIGCGTGFIIHLAADLFDEIHGVDITPAMMAQVRTEIGDITLHTAPAEKLPFGPASFDAATAYSFIDHLADPAAVLAEVARVLKPDGVFYADLVPNRMFWQTLTGIKSGTTHGLSDIVSRELTMVTANAKIMQSRFGIDEATFIAAEPGKERGGVDPEIFRAQALASGFASCDVHFDWFLGQASVMHRQSSGDAETIDLYLKRVAPLADHLYKYLYFFARK
jgi:ubiquinone/menaquinone biosynthesis C-methylase UbiE